MIAARRLQRQFGDGFVAEAAVEDLWEPWMRHADVALEDDALLLLIQHELAQRCQKSKTRGRKATPAEVVLRMLLLKHVRDWSFETLTREVRANLVYRQFTRIGGEKGPRADAHPEEGRSRGAQGGNAVARPEPIRQAKGAGECARQPQQNRDRPAEDEEGLSPTLRDHQPGCWASQEIFVRDCQARQARQSVGTAQSQKATPSDDSPDPAGDASDTGARFTRQYQGRGKAAQHLRDAHRGNPQGQGA